MFWIYIRSQCTFPTCSLTFFWCFQGVEKGCIGKDWVKEVLAVSGFLIDICYKFVVLSRDFYIKKCGTSLRYFIFKSDEVVLSWAVSCCLVPFHIKNISSINLEQIVRISYPWHNLSFEDNVCSSTQSCLRLKKSRECCYCFCFYIFTGVLFKWLFYRFYSLSIWDTCVQGFNIKRYQIRTIWDKFYCG